MTRLTGEQPGRRRLHLISSPIMGRANPRFTTWHITFGTYGTRLHGGERPTVNVTHNQRGEPFIERDITLEQTKRHQMSAPPVHLTIEQQQFIQQKVPSICQRGGWQFRLCSAGDDHVHVLLDVDAAVHGEKVRRLLKRWLSQVLNEKWPRPAGGRWWAEQGSNKAIRDPAHLENACAYIARQRA